MFHPLALGSGLPLRALGRGGGWGAGRPCSAQRAHKNGPDTAIQFHLLEPGEEERLSRQPASPGLGRGQGSSPQPFRDPPGDSAGPRPDAHSSLCSSSRPGRPPPPAELTGDREAHRESEPLLALGHPDAHHGRRSRKYVIARPRTVVRGRSGPSRNSGESRQLGRWRHLQREPEGILSPRPRSFVTKKKFRPKGGGFGQKGAHRKVCGPNTMPFDLRASGETGLKFGRKKGRMRGKAVLAFQYVRCCHLKKKFALWTPEDQ